jgi:HD-GYP domain-containing protein (c-di-GMP phosphodiesterase class II)
VEALRVAASLHDVGMLALPSSLWAQDARLTQEQMAQMQRHTTLGHELLAGASSPLARLAAELALTHHERLDGSGYPRGLRAAEVPILSRILAVADVFNALVSPRRYRPAMSSDDAIALMQSEMAGKLDPDGLQALSRMTMPLEGAESSRIKAIGEAGKRHA